jgi:hypothetical protein
VKETNDTGRTSSEDTTNKDIITPGPLDTTNDINKYRQVVNNSKDEVSEIKPTQYSIMYYLLTLLVM